MVFKRGYAYELTLLVATVVIAVIAAAIAVFGK
jgi:hypothetical protein